MNLAEEIKHRLTMQRVAEQYGFTPGRSGFIQCPFHQGDRTASLKIYPGDKGWKCFGCGRGGSVIDFVMELFDIPFRQACIRLSQDFGLDLTPTRRTTLEASKILSERRAEAERIARELQEYNTMAAEHCYWLEITKYFAPVPSDNGWIHPFYAEAIKRLPYLEYWLDENLGRGFR